MQILVMILVLIILFSFINLFLIFYLDDVVVQNKKTLITNFIVLSNLSILLFALFAYTGIDLSEHGKTPEPDKTFILSTPDEVVPFIDHLQTLNTTRDYIFDFDKKLFYVVNNKITEKETVLKTKEEVESYLKELEKEGTAKDFIQVESKDVFLVNIRESEDKK